jgi:hypothetical protein
MDASANLLEAFSSPRLIDPRRAQGLRHPLGSILALTTVAILTGARSQRAVVQFGRAYGRDFLRLLGFPKRNPPSEATLSRVFRAIDAVTFESIVRAWIIARLGSRRYNHLAIDGKTLRGTRGDDLPAVHLLTAYACELKVAVAQLRVDSKTNEHKAALELLGVPPLKGKVVTADAMFTHRDFCTKVRERGGHYVLPAKDNQPNLVRDIQAAFDDPPAGLSPPTDPAACREF